MQYTLLIFFSNDTVTCHDEGLADCHKGWFDPADRQGASVGDYRWTPFLVPIGITDLRIPG